MAKKIPLQNGMFAIVDDEDYERCMEFNWFTSYPEDKRVLTTLPGGEWIELSNFVMGVKTSSEDAIFHKDFDDYNFTKENLFIANNRTKFFRYGPSKNNTTGYKGVTYDKKRKKWVAQIMVDRKHIQLGRYDNKDDAAIAYNEAAKEHFGNHAFLNEIGVDNRKPLMNTEQKRPRTIKRKRAKYRGVTYKKRTRQADNYEVRISHEGKRLHVGSFPLDQEEEAARAYDKKARELFGDKAILNFPKEGANGKQAQG